MEMEDAKPAPDSTVQPDLFEENFKELQKWVDVKSSRYGTLYIIRERRKGRLGTALKVLCFVEWRFRKPLSGLIRFRWKMICHCMTKNHALNIHAQKLNKPSFRKFDITMHDGY